MAYYNIGFERIESTLGVDQHLSDLRYQCHIDTGGARSRRCYDSNATAFSAGYAAQLPRLLAAFFAFAHVWSNKRPDLTAMASEGVLAYK